MKKVLFLITFVLSTAWMAEAKAEAKRSSNEVADLGYSRTHVNFGRRPYGGVFQDCAELTVAQLRGLRKVAENASRSRERFHALQALYMACDVDHVYAGILLKDAYVPNRALAAVIMLSYPTSTTESIVESYTRSAIQAYSSEPDRSVREFVLQYMCDKNSDERFLPTLHAALYDGFYPWVNVARCLTDRNHPSSIPHMVSFLGVSRPDHQLEYIVALESHGPRARSAIPVLRDLVTRRSATQHGDSSNSVLSVAARSMVALARLGDRAWLIPRVMGALSEPHAIIRRSAVETVGLLHLTSAAPQLVAIQLHDPDPWVQAAALGSLAAVAGPTSIKPLKETAVQHPVASVRVTAVLALGSIRSIQVLGPLGELLESHPDEAVRQTVATSLGIMGYPQALKILKEARGKEANPLVLAAIDSSLRALRK